jgi:hypothetical protein
VPLSQEPLHLMRCLLATVCLSLSATGCATLGAQRDPAYAAKWDSVNACVREHRENAARMQEVCGKQFSNFEISGRVLSVENRVAGFAVRLDGLRKTDVSDESHEQTVCSLDRTVSRETLAQLAPRKSWITVRGSVEQLMGASAGSVYLQTLFLRPCEIISTEELPAPAPAAQPRRK